MRSARLLPAWLLMGSALLPVLCGCNIPGGKLTRVTIDEEPNLFVELLHDEGRPVWVDVRIYIDGKEVCPPQRIRRPLMRPRVDEVALRVDEGEHMLRVETLDGKAVREAPFKMSRKSLYAHVTYRKGRKASGSHASQTRELEIVFRDYGIGFA